MHWYQVQGCHSKSFILKCNTHHQIPRFHYFVRAVLSRFSCVWLFETPWTAAPRLLCPWGFSRQEYWSGLPCPPPGDLPNPGMEPRSPALQADFLPSKPPGKPKNTGLGSLFLLQGIFPTQELNWGLLPCRWILHQLSPPLSPLHSFILPWKDEQNGS